MKQTISLTDNYRKRLKDEICMNPGSGLRGEVEIRVKNKETGEIESTQRKNLIVYGGREWLLKKAFASNVGLDSETLETLRRSEILWFGVGSGGAEPGNPLQCGTTYGSDKDLYNPVRLRYEFDTNATTNSNYASRIINNKIVNGYYKRISYIGVKEDLANPYKVNGTVCYPNLIAEIRLEISTDDCCGQTYREESVEKSYADINEAALFIADPSITDPGKESRLTRVAQDYYNYDPDYNRWYYEQDLVLPRHDKTVNTITWTAEKPFHQNSVQYFDVYRKTLLDSEEEAKRYAGKTYKEETADGTLYYSLELISDLPALLGIFDQKDTIHPCTGSLTLGSGKITASFTKGDNSRQFDISTPGLEDTDDMNNLLFLSHGTIFVKCTKFDRFVRTSENNIEVFCDYRNGYGSNGSTLTYPSTNIFSMNTEKNEHVFIFPIGYYFDENNNLMECPEDNELTNYSIIRVTQSRDTYITLPINEIVIDPNSTECRFYVSNEDIKHISEGLKLFVSYKPEKTVSGEDVVNDIPQIVPATVVEIYDAEQHTNISTTTKSYFVIDRSDLSTEAYKQDDPMQCKFYTTSIDTPYQMFNRVCFSTIRMSHSREVLLVWRIYF